MNTLDRNLPRQGNETPVPAPRFVSSHPAIFVVLMYFSLVALAATFFMGLGAAQGNPTDSRNTFVVLLFAVIMAVPFIRALIAAFKRPHLPSYARRR